MGFSWFEFRLRLASLVQGWRKLGGTSIRFVRKCFALSGEGALRSGVYRAVFLCVSNVLPRQAGRPAGTQNRVTVILKNAIIESFERLGGVAYLEQVARTDPKTYLTLLAKIVPRTESKPETTVSTLSDAEIRSRVALMLREGLSAEVVSTGDSVDVEAVTIKQAKL